MTYRGMSMTWQNGRNLMNIIQGGFQTSYTYDASGNRIKKTVNNVSTLYYYDDSGNLLMQTDGTNKIKFFMGLQSGNPTGFDYNGQKYWYVYNKQGDVIALYSESSNSICVEYTYDAWGNVISITGTGASTIGQTNPIRYRGYYYDAETGFYHLGSRYYDPVTHRFINADGYVSTGQGVNGTNMFAYCMNNPVNMSDPTGNWPQWIKDAVKWVADKIVKPIVKGVQEALSEVDATYSRGINISGTPSAFIFNLQAGISVDTKGNVAIQGSAGGGVTGGSPGVSITTYQSVTNAPSIDKLEGPGYQIGGSAGVPVYGVPLAAGGDFNIIPDSTLNTTYLGVTTNGGFGTPGGEFHVEWSETATWNTTRFNVFDVAEEIYIKIMEW